MMHLFFATVGRLVGRALLLLPLLALLARPATAQTPPWVLATAPTGTTVTTGALVPDAAGNLVVAGYFSGQLTLGSTVLTSAGGSDWFVAKYAPATGTWLWALRGGGTGTDYVYGVALSGSSVYVTGNITNTAANGRQVTFGGTSAATGTLALAGVSAGTENTDVALVKFTDSGSSAAAVWGQVAGGTGADNGFGVAVSGSSVYVTGNIINNQANANAVVFGGSGLVAGTAAQAGATASSTASDLFLAKYTDQGASVTLGWTQVAGGSYDDYATGVAVSGTSVYLVGSVGNSRTNAQGVLFGGSGLVPGTVAQYGAAATSSQDLVLAKYTDNGSSATLGWTQVAGGTGLDEGIAVAASGSSVYVLGNAANDHADTYAVRVGGSGTTAGPVAQAGASPLLSADLLLAKYTDNGPSASVAWTQVAGGTGQDAAGGLAVLGSRVYVVGALANNTSNDAEVAFGGSGLAAGTASQAGLAMFVGTDVLAAGYLDNGPTATLAWTQVAGGSGDDQALAVAAAGTRLFVGGLVVPAAAFGPLSLGTPAGLPTPFAATLDLTATLATAPATALPALALYPSPASGPATLSSAAPATTGQVVDRLGREVASFRTDAAGMAALPAGLAPGLYLVRVGAATARWVVR